MTSCLAIMTTFAIMTPPDSPQLSQFVAALDRVFAGNYRTVGTGQYLAARSNTTSGQVAEMIGLRGEVGQFVVVTSAGWGGWHQNAIWEWLRIQDAAP